MKNKTTFLLLRDDYKSITDLLFNFYLAGVQTYRLGWGFSLDKKGTVAVAVKVDYDSNQSGEITRVLGEFNISPILNMERYDLFFDRVLVTGDTCELSAQVFTELKKEVRYGAA